MGRKHLGLVQYNSPDVVPANLRVVAAIDYSGGNPPTNLEEVSSHWYNPGDTIPRRFQKLGVVKYNAGDPVPANLPVLAAMEPDPILDAVEYPQQLLNRGFETAGVPTFANWGELGTDGAIADETVLVHTGAHAAKVTAGASTDKRIGQSYVAIPTRTYQLTFWTAGDGTNAGRYAVYDNTHGAYIVGVTSTGITVAAYSRVEVYFQAPVGCVSVNIGFWCPNVNGGIAYFDDASVKGPTE